MLTKRIGSLLITVVAGALLAGCAGSTTGASSITHSAATLNAKGSCDRSCIAFFRITSDGRRWSYGPPIYVGQLPTTKFHKRVYGLRATTSYGFQVCGAELPAQEAVCVGRNGQVGALDKFATGRTPSKPPRAGELDGADDLTSAPPIPIAGE